MSCHRKAVHCLALLVLLLTICVPAQGQTLYQMLEVIVKEHDLIQAAQAGRDASAQGVRRAAGEWLPQVALTANAGHEYIDDPRLADYTSEDRNLQSLRATQLIYDFGRTGSAIRMARAGLARSDTGLEATRQDIIFQGTEAYFNVYRNAERLRLARESENRLIELTGIEETLVTRGAGLASDVLQAKSQLAGARALRVRAEGQLNNARHRFEAVFGFSLADDDIEIMALPAKPEENLPASLGEAINVAAANSFDLLIAGHDLDIAEQEIQLRRSRYYPGLYLVGEGKRRENDIGIRGTRYEALGMVELTWNLFSGGSDRAAVAQARHNLLVVEKRRENLEQLIAEQVNVAWQNLLTARENARLLKDQAIIMEEFLSIARRERMLGTRSLLDVLNGELTYLNALSNAVSADIDRNLATYSVFYAMGMLELGMFK